MNTTHSIVGELVAADFDVQHGLPTVTLHLRQCCIGYNRQHITALRSYPSTLAAARLARDDYRALRMGALYRVQAAGISPARGVVYLLGVTGACELTPEPLAYPAARALEHEPNSLAAEAACLGLAMSVPPALQAAVEAL